VSDKHINMNDHSDIHDYAPYVAALQEHVWSLLCFLAFYLIVSVVLAGARPLVPSGLQDFILNVEADDNT
jgi:hypothetical protein